MTPEHGLALLLASAVLLAWARLLFWRAQVGGWRLAALIGLQPVFAALLYLTLLPPRGGAADAILVIATRGAPAFLSSAGERLVALPEAPFRAGVERAPDLATALRRHPADRLRVIGQGLEPRDRDTVGDRALVFTAPPAHGLVRIDPPGPVAPGGVFQLGGQVVDVPGGTVALIDPAGRRVDGAKADAAFLLSGTVRAAGTATFVLRLRDASGRVVTDVQVPVLARATLAPRVLLLSGAAGPEIKYLRRWAGDAGLALVTRIAVGGGVEIGDPPVALTPAGLAPFDLMIIDDRSWAGLAGGERAALMGAVRGGRGLLLRSDGPLAAVTRQQWQALGFGIGPAISTARLAPVADDAAFRARRGDLGDPLAARDDLPELTRLALAPQAGMVALARAADGTLLAGWRGLGSGRIGFVGTIDSFALTLAGHGDRHAEFWSGLVTVLARPGSMAAMVPILPRAGERTRVCRIGTQAAVVAPDGTTMRLLRDPTANDCAAWWPSEAGWHEIRQRDASGGSVATPVFVMAADSFPAAQAAADGDATAQLVSDGTGAKAALTVGARGSPLPWFLAWLVSAVVLWGIERRRTAVFA